MIPMLPFPPRRAWRLAFVAAVGVFAAAASGTVLLPVAGVWSLPLGVGVGVLVVGAGLFSERAAVLQYRAYNKAVRIFTRGAVAWTSLVCYFVFFRPVSWAGSRCQLERHGPLSSNWSAVESPSEALPVPQDRGWMSGYFSWCMKADNLWAVGLFPFLILLSLVTTGAEEKDNVPGNIYTLY